MQPFYQPLSSFWNLLPERAVFHGVQKPRIFSRQHADIAMTMTVRAHLAASMVQSVDDANRPPFKTCRGQTWRCPAKEEKCPWRWCTVQTQADGKESTLWQQPQLAALQCHK
jgi:hypothetical protein